MITMTTAAWIASAIVAVIFTLLLRLTIRVFAKTADNGWDNAISYGIVTVLLAIPVGWMMKAGFFWASLAPFLVWVVQTIALRFIYELKTGRAWIVGVVHAFMVTVASTTLALGVAVVAAYILYGKIISDPMFLIRLILKWLGIELPIFE